MDEEEAPRGLPSTKGTFTLKGAAEKAEGKYAYILQNLNEDILLGISDSSGKTFEGVPIKNGVAKIPLYLFVVNGQKIKAYNRNETINTLRVFVSEKKELSQSEIVAIDKYVLFGNVAFANGKYELDLSEAYSNKL
jgi:hypothetical protein